MGLFDEMFKKNEFDKKMDDVYNDFVENNPVTKKAKATIEEAKAGITHALEEELYGTSDEGPVAEGDDEALMQKWDAMIDQIVDKELSRYKICPSCGEAAPAEMNFCPNWEQSCRRILRKSVSVRSVAQ